MPLGPGDSWTVPKGSKHRYKILETFSAVETTSPPAEVHGRDANMASDKDKECKDGAKECSSENNSVAEFVKATSVAESTTNGSPAPSQGAVDKTTEVSPMDKGSDDELDGSAAPKEGETAESKKAEAPVEGKPTEAPAAEPDEADKAKNGPKDSAKDGAKEETAKKSEDEPKVDDGSEEAAADVQEIAGQIGRPDSKVTSNAPDKKAEPAEHIDLDKSA
ncbi:hypothetical protein BH11CYA1_BH11CYA1_12830 [soil metagenome]